MNDLSPEPLDASGRLPEPPPKMVLFTLAALVFLCMILGSGIMALLSQWQNIEIQTIISSFGDESSLPERNFMRGTLLLNHLMTFMVPALIAGWVFYKKSWPQGVRLNMPPDLKVLGLGILFVMSAFPLAQVAFTLNQWLAAQIPFLEDLIKTETASENLIEGLLVMQTPWELLFSVLVMAVVPAVGEELVFRGFIQRHLIRLSGKPLLGIVLTALVFSVVHFQVQRFIAIFLLGTVLGLLFFWTKNLWIPIIAHCLNNGAQVVIAYFNQDKLHEMNKGAGDELPVTLIALSAVIVVVTGYQLWKMCRHQKSPPPDAGNMNSGN